MGFKKLKGYPFRVAVIIWVVFTAMFLGSCEKNEGLGGTGSISGIIVEQFYNRDFSESFYSSPAVDEDVFILFGDNTTPGEDVTTGISGEFRFNYLYPGSYVIYYKSDDSSGSGETDWRTYEVELANGEDLDLGELEKSSALDWDDGTSVISGVVERTKYDNDSKWPNLVWQYTDFAHDHEVFILYGDDEYYSDRIRTSYDGYFEFPDLIPGNYLVFLYSEDVTKVTEHVVLKYEVEITEFDQVVDLGTISIEEI